MHQGCNHSWKAEGTKVLGPNTGAFAPCALPKARLGVGCRRVSPPPAVSVRGYHPQKILENSDAKSCILVTTCSEISCFLKTTANTLLVPQPKSWGTSLPRSLWLLHLCYALFFVQYKCKSVFPSHNSVRWDCSTHLLSWHYAYTQCYISFVTCHYVPRFLTDINLYHRSINILSRCRTSYSRGIISCSHR